MVTMGDKKKHTPLASIDPRNLKARQRTDRLGPVRKKPKITFDSAL